MGDPVIWGFKAIKPFDAEHPIGSGTMVHYNPGDEVPASEWGRAEGFMVEAGSIMRYAVNVAEVPGQVTSAPPAAATPPETPAAPPKEEVAPPAPPDEEVPDDATFPHKQSAGWYALSDGSKVHGKASAIAAQAALDVAGETAT